MIARRFTWIASAGDSPVEEPPNQPKRSPVQEPGETPVDPPPFRKPPVGDPDRIPRRPPVEEPPGRDEENKVRNSGAVTISGDGAR